MTEKSKEVETLKKPISRLPWQWIKLSKISKYWFFSTLSSLILPLGLTHGSVLYYCIKNDLPAITVLNDIDGLYEVGLVGTLFLFFTQILFILPAFLKISLEETNEQNGTDLDEKVRKNITSPHKRWIEILLPGYVLYIWFIIEGTNNEPIVFLRVLFSVIIFFTFYCTIHNHYKKFEKNLFKKITYQIIISITNPILITFNLILIYLYAIDSNNLDTTPEWIQELILILMIIYPLLINIALFVKNQSYKTLSLIGGAILLLQIFYFPGASFFVEKTFNLLKIGGGQIIEIAVNKKAACTYPPLFEVNLTGTVLNCNNSNTSEFADIYKTKPLKVMYISRRIIIIQGNQNFEDDKGEQKSSLVTVEIDRSEVRAVYFIDNIQDNSNKI
jgi:hypothetical protein